MNKDPREVYSDIIDLPHWQSPKHPQLSLYDRAAQFSPFAALTGYDDMIAEEARETGSRIHLEEREQLILDEKIALIAENGHPDISVTYFVPDKMKEGGSYVTVAGRVKRIDTAFRKILLNDTEIDLKDVIRIRGELVDYLDDIGDW